MESLSDIYRHILVSPSFLSLLNLILTTFVIGICWFLLMYRSVGFYAKADVEILTNEKLGQIKRWGEVKSRVTTRVRLPIGKRLIVFRDEATKEAFHSKTITVRPFWVKEQDRVDVPEMSRYEQTLLIKCNSSLGWTRKSFMRKCRRISASHRLRHGTNSAGGQLLRAPQSVSQLTFL